MNDVSNNDTENDTSNDAQVRPQVTWSNPVQQSVQQRITYGDGEDTITSVIQPNKYQDTSVKQPYIYKSYKDACTSNGSPITYGSDTNTQQSNIQVTSE